MVKKQKGGMNFPDYNYNDGGTGISDLPDNILGTVNYTIASVISGVDAVNSIMNINKDMGVAFSAKNAPNPDNVDVGKI